MSFTFMLFPFISSRSCSTLCKGSPVAPTLACRQAEEEAKGGRVRRRKRRRERGGRRRTRERVANEVQVPEQGAQPWLERGG